jgi:ATP-dependent DNA helicase RecG
MPQSDKQDGALARKILDVLTEDPTISQISLSEKLGLARRSIQRKMDELKSSGRIERVGGKRCGYWEIHRLINNRSYAIRRPGNR